MDYEQIRSFAAVFGLVYFVVLFVGVLVYALRPGNKDKFDAAARLPLEED